MTRSRPGPRQPGPQRQGPRPAGQGDIRLAAERRSAAPLVYLRQLPAWIPALALAGLLIAGLAVRGWIGAAALCVVAIFIGWLGYLSWPALSIAGRTGRALAFGCVLGLAVLQAAR